MGNWMSWFRPNLVDNDRKGPTSPRAFSDPELGRTNVAGRTSLGHFTPGRLSMENNAYLEKNHNFLTKSMQSTLSDYPSEDNPAMKQLKALCAEQQKTIEEYKEKLESQKQTSALLTSDRRSLSDRVEAKQTMEEYEAKLQSMEQTIAMLTSEKDALLDRLSEHGAMKLKFGNPNITDLSDCNRPEKLSEQLSELYDNQWTDSYQRLTSNGKLKDKDVVCTLLHILQVIYDICLSKSQALNQEMNTALGNFLGLDCSSEENVDIQAFKEKMVYTIQEFREQNCSLMPKIVKKDIRRELQINIDKSLVTLCKDYIAECSRICWNMCIKNPPMYITSEAEDLFNRDIYVPYTKTGPCIAYVVWPVVYLHKNGPIIKKGVAQGKKKKTTLTRVECNSTDRTEYKASLTRVKDNSTDRTEDLASLTKVEDNNIDRTDLASITKVEDNNIDRTEYKASLTKVDGNSIDRTEDLASLPTVGDNSIDRTEDIASSVVKSPSNEKADSAHDVQFINEEKSEGTIRKRRNSDPLLNKRHLVHNVPNGKLKSKTLETPNKTKEKPSKIPRLLKAHLNLKNQAMSNEV